MTILRADTTNGLISAALEATGQTRSSAARAAGLSHSVLHRAMSKPMGLDLASLWLTRIHGAPWVAVAGDGWAVGMAEDVARVMLGGDQ